MRFFLALFVFTSIAHAACDYTIRDRMFRTEEEKRIFRCDLNWSCLENVIKNQKGDSALDEIEKLADYSRNNRCDDELRLANLMRSAMSTAAAECNATIGPSDMVQELIFSAENTLQNNCNPQAPKALMAQCQAEGFTCTQEASESLNDRENCFVSITGRKTLPDTPEGQRLARCQKLIKCMDDALMSPDNEAAMTRIEGLLQSNHCQPAESVSGSVNQDQRGNNKSDLPAIPDAPATSGSRVLKQ